MYIYVFFCASNFHIAFKFLINLKHCGNQLLVLKGYMNWTVLEGEGRFAESWTKRPGISDKSFDKALKLNISSVLPKQISSIKNLLCFCCCTKFSSFEMMWNLLALTIICSYVKHVCIHIYTWNSSTSTTKRHSNVIKQNQFLLSVKG